MKKTVSALHAVIGAILCFMPLSAQDVPGDCISGNCANGEGTMFWPDGRKYVGTWKNKMRNGFGTWTHPNGRRFEGEWRDDKRHGKGTYFYPSGEKYVGEFDNDRVTGMGMQTFPDGERYTGYFIDGMRNGQGTVVLPNGTRYEGEWKDDLRQGNGILTLPDSSKYIGDFHEGKRVGQGMYIWPDGKRYTGLWANDKINGPGKMTLPDSTRFEGMFVEGVISGHGTWYFPDGGKFVGEWQNDRRNGHGLLYDKLGQLRQEGYWEDDKYIGTAPPGQARLAGEMTVDTATACLLEKAVDYGDPLTRNFALSLASQSPGDYSYRQVCAIYDHVRRNWKYTAVTERQGVFGKASESIKNGLTGDGNDFAILMCALVKALGGATRMVLVKDANRDRIYTEVLTGTQSEEVRRGLLELYQSTASEIHFRNDANGSWINLDWFSKYPGGLYLNSAFESVYIPGVASCH